MEPLKSIFGSENSTIKIGKRGLECYLLPGLEPVFDRRNFQKVLGYDGRSSRWLYDFLIHLSRHTPISVDVLDVIQENRHFSVTNPQGDLSLKAALDPQLAFKVCTIISKANQDGLLYLSELKYAKAADAILEALPKDQIEAAITFATGFDRYKINVRERMVKILSSYQPDDAYRWIMSIPDDFVEAVLEFYNTSWEEASENISEISQFIADYVFSRLEEKTITELRIAKPKMSYKKAGATEKYLPHPLFSQYLQGLFALIRLSNRHLALLTPLADKAFPVQRDIKIQARKNPAGSPPDFFEKILYKGLRKS